MRRDWIDRAGRVQNWGALLRHLAVAGEMLAAQLATTHNLHFYLNLMAEARRRGAAPTADLVAVVGARARRAIPKLAAAAAAAVAIAAAVSLVDRAPSGGASTSIESVILSGGEGRETGDILLEAVLAAEKSNG